MAKEKTDFDFSLIVSDTESSDGQSRYQHINNKETKTKTEPETTQK